MTPEEIVKEYVALYTEDGDIDCADEDLEVVSRGEWVQEHKYQYASHIVKYKDVYIQVDENRSGSYHTDWYYGDTTIQRVDRREETKVVNIVINDPVGEIFEIPSKY